MGVYVKGMCMPESCGECLLHRAMDYVLAWEFWCGIDNRPIENINECLDNCPLVEVPTPHGRLIDGSELVVKYDLYAPIAPVVEGDSEHWTNLIHTKHILTAPTVIEAEDE